METQDSPADGRALPDCGQLSEAVRAAQEKLLELRRLHGVDAHGRNPEQLWRDLANRDLANRATGPVGGWHSEPLTRHLRAAAGRRRKQAAAGNRSWLEALRRDITTEANAPAPPFPPPPADAPKAAHGNSSDDRCRHSALVNV